MLVNTYPDLRYAVKYIANIIVCEGCDAVYRQVELKSREILSCPRCGNELARHPGTQAKRILPLTVASLIVFIIAHAFPIVEIEIRGLSSQTTLVGAVIALSSEGLSMVALLVLATTLLLPLLQLLILLWLLLPLIAQRRVAGFAVLQRMMHKLRPWGMIDIFLLGVLVAIIKLSSMATVLPGPALWAFIALTLLLTMVMAFDLSGLWKLLAAIEDNETNGERQP
jgi:paraquat-inducible protein A